MNRINNDSFIANVTLAVSDAKENLDQVVMLFGAQVLRNLVYLSPVDTGRFRANWQVSFDTPEVGEVNAVDQDGSETISRETPKLMSFNSAVHSIWFTNNVVYAYALEMGHSQQAPAGMIGVTVPKIQKWISQAVAEVNKNV